MPTTARRHALPFAIGAAASAALLLAIGAGQAQQNAQPANAATPDRTSYAIGHDLGLSTLDRLSIDGVEYDRDALMQGFTDAMLDNPSVFPPEDLAASLAVLQRQVATRTARERIENDPVFKALADENARKSREFLAAFAKRDNVRTLDSGVLAEERSGTKSRQPRPEDTVVISFQARLIDGTLIGDEVELTARIDGMIEGARIALTQMNVGNRWIVAIPPEAAFGIGGRLPDIGPNQALLADVTLVEIKQ